MKIAVCIKQVPLVSMLKFDNETRRLIREGVPSEVNHFDFLAVCAAVDLKKANGGEVVVYTMGPPQAREALVQCLALGADRAVHLTDRAFAGSDTLATARALSIALSNEGFDLVLCGRNSVDSETGQVGPEIAELLGVPQVTNVRKLDFDEAALSVRVERLTDEGHEVVMARLPALVTVGEDVAEEVYPRREALQEAQSKPIAEVSAAVLSADPGDFGIDGSPTWVGEIYSVEPERDGIVVRDVDTDEAIERLLAYLDERGAFDQDSNAASEAPQRGGPREKSAAGSIWVFAEVLGQEIRPVTFEMLGRSVELADELGTNVEAVLMGGGIASHAGELAAHGADVVRVADDARLAGYDTRTYAHVLARAIEAHRPYAVLFGSTVIGRDLAARLAARLDLGLTGDCVGLEIDEEGRLVQLKPAFGGNIVAPILSKTVPYMSTLRPGMLTPVQPDGTVEATVESLDLGGMPDPAVEVVERVVDSSAEGANLENAKIIVSAGQGIGGPENLPVLEGLAEALGAGLGATRNITDLGWLPRQYQIGLSGKAVAPDLYFAVGVRGVFNHMVGVQKAGTIVAINDRARSPIFKAADIGIVGDYAEIVPALTQALKRRRNL